MYDKLFYKRYVQQLRGGGVTYTCYTDGVCIIVTALYIWIDTYCFLCMKQIFQLTWKSQQLHKGINMIKAHVYDQNVLQLTYLLAVQLTLSLAGS